MIQSILFILLVFGIFLDSYCQESRKEYMEIMRETIISSYSKDINGDKKPDNIILKFPARSDDPKYAYDDPGQFFIVEIELSNQPIFKLKDTFDYLPKCLIESNNEVDSKFVFITKEINGSRFIILNGAQYGCCLRKLFILKVHGDKIRLIHDNEFKLSKFTYDGKLNIYYLTGFTELSESWGGFKTKFEYQRFTYPKTFVLNNDLRYSDQLTAQNNKNEIEKYGDFLTYKNPTIVINKVTNERFMVNLTPEINLKYQLKYDVVSRSKLNSKYFEKFSKEELRIMRNEIFASYGYIFSSKDLKEYFEGTKWYTPSSKNVDNKLTDIEKYNIKLIQQAEQNAP
jgi:hypothetical protein